MRFFGFMLLGIFGMVLVAGAQTPGTSTSKSPTPNPKTAEPTRPVMSEKSQKYLDAYLGHWENRMSKVPSLETKVVLTEVDHTEKEGPQKTVYTGEASIMKPNFAKLFLREQGKPEEVKRWRHYAADGKYLWDFNYSKKTGKVKELPKDGIDNTFFNFLFGMKAAELKRRYDLTINVEDPEQYGEHYMFITIYPKSKEDQQEFAKAQLVLWINTKDPKFADNWMLPARLWFQHTNKNQVIWEFQKMNAKKELLPADFKAPAFPDKEWKSEWMEAPKPTAVRSVPPK
jgi:TIGR03009 family protein